MVIVLPFGSFSFGNYFGCSQGTLCERAGLDGGFRKVDITDLGGGCLVASVISIFSLAPIL